MALLGLHVCERGDAHDVRDLRDDADGGGAAASLRLVDGGRSTGSSGGPPVLRHNINDVDDALRLCVSATRAACRPFHHGKALHSRDSWTPLIPPFLLMVKVSCCLVGGRPGVR